jgi:hypothetical protein
MEFTACICIKKMLCSTDRFVCFPVSVMGKMLRPAPLTPA